MRRRSGRLGFRWHAGGLPTKHIGKRTQYCQAESAKDAVALYKPWQGRIQDLLRESPDGKELIRKGFEKDVDFASKVNRVPAVPFLKNALFVKEDAPKIVRLTEDGKQKSSAPPKGKSIKVTVPLFPKNPEHPVPGMEKAGAKKTALAHDDKKHADVKHPESKQADVKHTDTKHADVKRSETKHADVKHEDKKKGKETAKKTEGKPSKPKGPAKPMFSKKTVATAVYKKVK